MTEYFKSMLQLCEKNSKTRHHVSRPQRVNLKQFECAQKQLYYDLGCAMEWIQQEHVTWFTCILLKNCDRLLVVLLSLVI